MSHQEKPERSETKSDKTKEGSRVKRTYKTRKATPETPEEPELIKFSIAVHPDVAKRVGELAKLLEADINTVADHALIFGFGPLEELASTPEGYRKFFNHIAGGHILNKYNGYASCIKELGPSDDSTPEINFKPQDLLDILNILTACRVFAMSIEGYPFHLPPESGPGSESSCEIQKTAEMLIASIDRIVSMIEERVES